MLINEHMLMSINVSFFKHTNSYEFLPTNNIAYEFIRIYTNFYIIFSQYLAQSNLSFVKIRKNSYET